jgi:basic membrane protein A and related proteins
MEASINKPSSPIHRVFLGLVAANLSLLVLGELAFGEKAARVGSSFRVGLVFDVGGLGDKSFNDLANAGLQRAVKELGVDAQYLEPSEGSDREAGLRQFASQGYDVIIGVGFIFSSDMMTMAKEYPNTNFACVDFAPPFDAQGKELPIPKNLVGLKFREEEGSFLVGALAGLQSKSKKIGFVGGMTIPLIRKFQAGYEAGVKATCSACETFANYAGSDPTAFKNPVKGKEHALAQHARGVDIIYHASGSTGLGVFEAAREQGFLAIGVDADQYDEMPGTVLTSMVKGVDVSVFEAIKRTVNKDFVGGLQVFGLKEQGVDYIYNEHNQTQEGKDKALYIEPEIRAKVEALRAQIIDGTIKVPSVLPQ